MGASPMRLRLEPRVHGRGARATRLLRHALRMTSLAALGLPANLSDHFPASRITIMIRFASTEAPQTASRVTTTGLEKSVAAAGGGGSISTVGACSSILAIDSRSTCRLAWI